MSQTPFQNVNKPHEWQQRRQDYENWQLRHSFSNMQPQPDFSSPPPPYFNYGQRMNPRQSNIPYSVPHQYGNFQENFILQHHQNFPIDRQPHGQGRACSLEEQQDKAWLTTWLIARDKGLPKKQTKPAVALNIRQAHQTISSCATYLKEMKELHNEMQTNLDDELSDWNEKVNKMNELKQHVLTLMTNLEDNSTVLTLRKLVAKRSAKRKLKQQKKLQRKKQLEIMSARRQALHMQIDAWRLQQQQQVERAKREEDTRREADAVLAEVRRKQSEGRRWQQVLEDLNKLRHLRARAAFDKGLQPTPQENERFSQVTNQLSELWKSQLKEYKAEEHALKVMLEEEAEVRGHQHKASKQLIPLAEWERLIFGPVPDTNSEEFQYHTRADFDLQNFINIRQEWDQFVAPPGAILSSAPPVGWILPQPASSSDWASLLVGPQRN